MGLWEMAEPVKDSDLTDVATLHGHIAGPAGFDEFNQPVTNDEVIDCRFEPTNELFTTGSGREEVSQAMVFTKMLVTVQDSITFDGKTFPVKKVEKLKHQDNTFSHYEVWL